MERATPSIGEIEIPAGVGRGFRFQTRARKQKEVFRGGGYGIWPAHTGPTRKRAGQIVKA